MATPQHVGEEVIMLSFKFLSRVKINDEC